MSVHKSGNRLIRHAFLSYSSSCQRCFSSCLLRNGIPSPNQLEHSSFWRVHSKASSTRCCVPRTWSRVRFYTQDGTQDNILKTEEEGQSADHLKNATRPAVEKDATIVLHPLSEENEPEFQGPERRGALFYDLLTACQSPSDVLDLAEKYTLTWRRVSNSLTKIWETTKKLSEEQRRYERRLMFEHPVFEQLCQRLMEDSHKMRSDDLAYSLLALVKLGVSQRSQVIQTLLRVIQENLNKFEERALSVLANCLEEMEGSINVDALKAGLRLLVEIRIPKIKNVAALQTMMRCIGRDAPVSLKRKLEHKALSMVRQFSVPNSQYMFTTLAAMNFPSKALLDFCSKKIAENIHGIPFWRLMYVLQSSRDLRYHNYTLLSAIGSYVASTFDMWSSKQVILFLLLFEDHGFRHVGLMDTFAETVMKDPDSLILKDVLNILKVYSQLNHFPQRHGQQFPESLSNVLETYLSKILPAELLRGVFSLCLLGHFSNVLMDKLQQKDVLDELLFQEGRNQGMHERMLHYVNLCLQLDSPFVSSTTALSVAKPPSTTFPVNLELLRTLQVILEGRSFQKEVLLENGYFIDFSITLEKTVKNICDSTQENEAAISEDCRRVAVLCGQSSSFCLGTLHPRGKLAMKMRHLAALGYDTVLVPKHEFETLSEEERVEFLKKRIFAQTETTGVVSTKSLKQVIVTN
ncbi:FAST kinase domain-containing protein 2, mitochondrial [Lepisosteus oculatus]|uniref:FAST kinase domain-containing protein 2, mitochondrial n=1 Tax=Lepisosteus oculatus TaxID=7918 RepID=UPI0035F51D44